MTQVFFKAKGFVSGRTLATLTNVESIISVAEKESYDHWIFNNGSASLFGLNAGKSLTLRAGATLQPIYHGDGVEISTLTSNPLLSDFSDSSSNNYTVAAVITGIGAAKEITHLMGNLPLGSAGSGAGAFLEYSRINFNVRPAANTSNVSNALTLDTLKPFLAIYSVDKQSKVQTMYVEQSGNIFEATKAFAEAYTANGNVLAMGNIALTSQVIERKMKYSEFIIFPKALNTSEIRLLAERSKGRMVDLGIIV